jgi:preprotein translocase subunit SecE
LQMVIYFVAIRHFIFWIVDLARSKILRN